jgi:hypothetical protein
MPSLHLLPGDPSRVGIPRPHERTDRTGIELLDALRRSGILPNSLLPKKPGYKQKRKGRFFPGRNVGEVLKIHPGSPDPKGFSLLHQPPLHKKLAIIGVLKDHRFTGFQRSAQQRGEPHAKKPLLPGSSGEGISQAGDEAQNPGNPRMTGRQRSVDHRFEGVAEHHLGREGAEKVRKLPKTFAIPQGVHPRSGQGDGDILRSQGSHTFPDIFGGLLMRSHRKNLVPPSGKFPKKSTPKVIERGSIPPEKNDPSHTKTSGKT